MEVIAIYNPQRRHVAVQRHPDSPPRLVILACWGMSDAELLRAVRPLLEPGELASVTQALGLNRQRQNG